MRHSRTCSKQTTCSIQHRGGAAVDMRVQPCGTSISTLFLKLTSDNVMILSPSWQQSGTDLNMQHTLIKTTMSCIRNQWVKIDTHWHTHTHTHTHTHMLNVIMNVTFRLPPLELSSWPGFPVLNGLSTMWAAKQEPSVKGTINLHPLLGSRSSVRACASCEHTRCPHGTQCHHPDDTHVNVGPLLVFIKTNC